MKEKINDPWIASRDRLPKENEEVLIFASLYGTPVPLEFIRVGEGYNSTPDQEACEENWEWRVEGEHLSPSFTVYWMPLPMSPYEIEKQNKKIEKANEQR